MNKQSKIDVMVKSFNNLNKLPKALIKYGLYVSLTVFVIGAIMVLLNNNVFPYTRYMDMISKSIFTTSFSLAAEAVIGGLIMDIVFRR